MLATCTPTYTDTHYKQNVKLVHLEVIDGKHKLRKAWELEEKEVTGLEHLTGVAKSII